MYNKDTLDDRYYQHYPEDAAVVRELYDIFTCVDELYVYTQYEIICDEIRKLID